MSVKTVPQLKEFFETGDRPTQQQFADLIDSFLHKQSGTIVTAKSYNEATGDVVISFSDSTTLTFNIKGNESEGIEFINGLQAALDAKVDKETGKGLSTNDFTTALLNKLNGLSNYVPPTSQEISFINGLAVALADKANDNEVVKSVNNVVPDVNGNVVVVIPELNELASNGLSIRDGNDIEQFVCDEKLLLKGGVFDVPNKSWSPSALTYNTVYVNVTSGNDSTAEILNSNKPFLTLAAAFLHIPDGEKWNIVFLDSATRVLPYDANKKISYFTENSGTINISAYPSGAMDTFVFYCPNSNIIHQNVAETTITSANSGYVVCDIFTSNTPKKTASNSVFQFKCHIKANEIRALNTSKSLFSSGSIICGKYETTHTNLFYTSGSDTRHDIGEINLSGQTFSLSIGSINRLNCNKITGTGTFSTIYIPVFDVSGLATEAGIDIYIGSNSMLTGTANDFFLGTITIKGTTKFNIHNFFGRINKIDSSAGFNTTDVEISNSTIFLLAGLFIGWSGTSFSRTWNIANTEFIQDTASPLFENIPVAGLILNKTGYIKSNGTLGANVTVQSRTSNTF